MDLTHLIGCKITAKFKYTILTGIVEVCIYTGELIVTHKSDWMTLDYNHDLIYYEVLNTEINNNQLKLF